MLEYFLRQWPLQVQFSCFITDVGYLSVGQSFFISFIYDPRKVFILRPGVCHDHVVILAQTINRQIINNTTLLIGHDAQLDLPDGLSSQISA